MTACAACAGSAADSSTTGGTGAEVSAGAITTGSVGAGDDAAALATPESTSAATRPTPAPVTTVSGSAVELPSDWDDFDESIADELVGWGAWSVSIAVARDGEIVHTAAIGIRDPDEEQRKGAEPAEPSDNYRIASNSKVLTAIVALRLVERGELNLDEAATPRLARKFGVEITEPGVADITVRQLLNHSSGFDEFERTFFGSRVDNCEEAAVVGLTTSLDHPPGSVFRYSNMNYCMLGLLIEDVTGERYERAVKDLLLQPLGIDDMRVAGTLDVRTGDAHHLSGELRNYMEVLYSAGAWVGTAEDLVRIVDSLDIARPGWHPLGAAGFEQMLARPDVEYPYSNRWYGLGLRVWKDGSWGHTGTVENARSMVLHRPDGLTWAVLVNGDTPKDTDDLRDLVDAAFAEVGIETPA